MPETSATPSAPAAVPPIDAVVTWVDGQDPAHAAKRAEWFAREEPGRDRKAARPTRFEQADEIRWCLSLLRKHAPWLRTIHLVTDAQCPAFLTASERERLGVVLVDHAVLFAGHDAWLPTFDSMSIETLLHRVPGLADRFLYFCDDVFLMQPATPADFFDGDKPRVRGAWVVALSKPARLVRELRRTAARHFVSATFRDGLNARWAESDVLPAFRARWFGLAHAPFALSKPLFRDAIEGEGRLDNARFRFRNVRQLNPVAFVVHRGLERGAVVPGPDDWEYLECTRHSSRVTAHRLSRCVAGGPAKTLCVQSLERAPVAVRALVMESLARAAA